MGVRHRHKLISPFAASTNVHSFHSFIQSVSFISNKLPLKYLSSPLKALKYLKIHEISKVKTDNIWFGMFQHFLFPYCPNYFKSYIHVTPLEPCFPQIGMLYDLYAHKRALIYGDPVVIFRGVRMIKSAFMHRRLLATVAFLSFPDHFGTPRFPHGYSFVLWKN